MGALMRYRAATVAHGQRYLAPVLLFGIALCVLTINDQGPLTGSYGVAAGSLLLTTCWLTTTILNLEDPARRAVSAVAAGGSGRVLSAELLLALSSGVVLAAVGLVFPIVAGHHVWSGVDVVAGAVAELTAVLTGTAVGVTTSRLVLPRPGFSLLTALIVVIVLLVAPDLPPVHSTLATLSGSDDARDQLVPLGRDLLIAAVVFAFRVAGTRAVAIRRD